MEIDGLKGVSQATPAAKVQNSPKTDSSSPTLFSGNVGELAQRKVDQKVIEKALNEPNPQKALQVLLANSPVGFGNQSTATELENLGYIDTGVRQMHLGAPIWYESKDGGKVTVYDDTRGPNGQTDVGPRTTIYENGGFKQVMTYDENGKLTGGKIVIKDEVGGFTERKIDFIVTSDGKIAIADAPVEDIPEPKPKVEYGEEEMNTLNKYTEKSCLQAKEPTTESLSETGFIRRSKDMNGGVRYYNSNSGESLRINQSWARNGNKCYELTNGNTQHSIIYDKDGKAIRGDVQILESDGTKTVISYKYDENGNKIITNVENYESDGFFSHDGDY